MQFCSINSVSLLLSFVRTYAHLLHIFSGCWKIFRGACEEARGKSSSFDYSYFVKGAEGF